MMTQKILENCLKPVTRAETHWRRRMALIFGLGAGALGMLVLALVARQAGWWSTPLAAGVFTASILAILIAFHRIASRRPDIAVLARKVEAEHPELNAALLTALEMKPDPDGRLSYLQTEVLRGVTEHAIRNHWVRQVSEKKLKRAGWIQLCAIVAFLVSGVFLLNQFPGFAGRGTMAQPTAEKPIPAEEPVGLEVKPGDTEVEKGGRVVIEARFRGRIPAGALVLLRDPADGSEKGRIPMRSGLEDSVFSAILTGVDEATNYEVRFEESVSDRFLIQTYEHPELERADARITPPAYVPVEPELIENTRKISLIEGSKVRWSMRVNKPVTFAELFGEDETSVALTPDPADPTLLLASHLPETTQRYRLHLIDDRDRANKRPPWFTVTVKKNLPPEMKFSFPGRDIDVSALEEFAVEAEVWDDIGIRTAGIVFEHGDEKREVILAEEELAGDRKHALKTMLAIEELGADPRELISYHLWAEDFAREGRVRRTQSDLFFAEVRHFEDIFREQQAPGGESQGQQGQSEELLKLQKDILNASWKLLRKAHLGKSATELKEDIDVVRESQEIAIQQTETAIENVEDAELKAFFNQAKEHMREAVEHFTIGFDPFAPAETRQSPAAPLELAHASAKRAYESLIKARSREHNVTQSAEPSGSGQPQERERQLMNLELKQKQLKYRENTSAQTEQQAAEQRENLEVLNKLKELARRQEAIAEKIKELQTELEDAASDEERERIERQLKRLQEEQEQLLRDLDDLSEKMDSPQNRADMAGERRRLEETRKHVQDTAEDLQEKNLADAANSATRARRELEEAEDEFRKRTARQFSEQMKEIRDAARQLAENQKAISETLDERPSSDRDSGNDFRTPEENLELARRIEEQRAQLAELVEAIKDVSEKAEESEPLLSDALYEAVRENMVNGVEQSLAEARDLVRYNRQSLAREPEQNAAQGIEDLKEQVESAAEQILGSEADSLRLARNELDRLIDQARAETERLRQEEAEKGKNGAPAGEGEEDLAAAGDPSPSARGDAPDQSDQEDSPSPGEGEKGSRPGQGKGKGDPASREPGSLAQSDREESSAGGRPAGGESEAETEESPEGKGKGKGKGRGGEGDSGEGNPKRLAENEEGQPSPRPGSGQRGGFRRLLSEGNRGERSTGSNFGGDDRGSRMPTGLASQPPLFFQRSGETQPAGPITGEEYKDFANALGNIEEMMNGEDLRNEIARVLDNARGMRVDYKRDNLPPGAESIRQKIIDPLVEVRSRVSEELAKLNRENPVAPIDRDPVPGEFRELVRRYYEELGAGN